MLPQIKVTDQQQAGHPLNEQGNVAQPPEGPFASLKLTPNLRSPTSPSATSNEILNGSNSDGRRPSEAAIDPLSQQILQRTNTSPAIQRLRSHNTEPVLSATTVSSSEAISDKKLSGESSRDIGGGHKADKKKGVSFLSRFIGSTKKKGIPSATNDNGFEPDDQRPEGMDAQLYVDNFGFSPKVPQAPAYIKVRSKFKKNKEFDRLFLAQVLRCGADKKSPPAAGSNPAPQSGSAAVQNPIWAVEFSKDGKYLAAGGQDRVIRVWAVISSSDDRQSHERAEGEEMKHLSAPVFQQQTVREYIGHTASILDLSWSKNNFLLSSSMDKTVRLWHVSRNENLCTFKHSDFVPSIQFHPTDDRFFLAGSLDAKLRLWSIPDKSIAYTVTIPDMITAVSFTPDGKTCIAGTLGGLCLFYDTEGLKWQSQLHVKSTRGQNAKGSKITGIQAVVWPPGSKNGETKLLVSSNDSRVRVYNLKDKNLDMKFRGHENNSSQIRATFADSSGHIICGSEDRKVYIWSTTALEGEKRDQRPVEMFEAHNSLTTCAAIAPIQTRRLLSASEDPIYDICNPPPVTLVSRAHSIRSSKAPTEAGSALPTPSHTDTSFNKAKETPAYLARCAHREGNIIVTADFTGALKVFRQDCAYAKRIRMSEQWDTSSVKRAGSKIGRPSSILSRTSRSRRDSISTQPPNDRIMTWRQGISHGSFDSSSSIARRSASPRKSLARQSLNSVRYPDSPNLVPTQTTETSSSGPAGTMITESRKTSISIDYNHPQTPSQGQSDEFTQSYTLQAERTHSSSYRVSAPPENPMAVYNGQSWAFWSIRNPIKQTLQADNNRPNLDPRKSDTSQISRLTSEPSDQEDNAQRRSKDACQNCGNEDFKADWMNKEEVLICQSCGKKASDERMYMKKAGRETNDYGKLYT